MRHKDRIVQSRSKGGNKKVSPTSKQRRIEKVETKKKEKDREGEREKKKWNERGRTENTPIYKEIVRR